MNPQDKWRLRRNRVELEELDADLMCSCMIAAEIISPDEMEEIQLPGTSKAKTGRLLSMLERKGPNAYQAFRNAVSTQTDRDDLVGKLDKTDMDKMSGKLKSQCKQANPAGKNLLKIKDEPDKAQVFVHVKDESGEASNITINYDDEEPASDLPKQEHKTKRQKTSGGSSSVVIRGNNNFVISGGSGLVINNHFSKKGK